MIFVKVSEYIVYWYLLAERCPLHEMVKFSSLGLILAKLVWVFGSKLVPYVISYPLSIFSSAIKTFDVQVINVWYSRARQFM